MADEEDHRTLYSVCRRMALFVATVLALTLGTKGRDMRASTMASWKHHAISTQLAASKTTRIPLSSSATSIQQQPPSALAWLMSFPNSGTSYTMRLLTRTTQTLAATNYHKKNQQLVPVYGGTMEGPFWPDPYLSANQYQLPPSFVFTKTHCGCHCNDCEPRLYLRDIENFVQTCATGSILVNETANSVETKKTVLYNATTLVKRAIHLIRNPFHNIVARFHLERRHHSLQQNITNSDSREGFRNFCRYMDDKWEESVERTWLRTDNEQQRLLQSVMRNVPCRDDFFRYALWHNLAFEVTDHDLRIPTLVIHYEDYADEVFNKTLSTLLDFLNETQTAPPYPFQRGHSYDDYFTAAEQRATAQALKLLSSDTTWHTIARYFPSKLFDGR